MRPAGEQAKHTDRILRAGRFSENCSVQRDQCIRSENQAAGMRPGDCFRFPGGKKGHSFLRRTVNGFIHIRTDTFKRNSGGGEQFTPAGRTGRKNQFLRKKTPSVT